MVLVKKINPILDISQKNGKGYYFEKLTLSIFISKRAVKAQIFPREQLRLHFGRANFKLMVPVKKINPILDISQIKG